MAGSSCTCPMCMPATFVVRENRTSVCPRAPRQLAVVSRKCATSEY
jgi:hypothetical protein